MPDTGKVGGNAQSVKLKLARAMTGTPVERQSSLLCGFDFLAIPLVHPRFRRQRLVPSAAAPPFTRSDLLLTSSQWSSQARSSNFLTDTEGQERRCWGPIHRLLGANALRTLKGEPDACAMQTSLHHTVFSFAACLLERRDKLMKMP